LARPGPPWPALARPGPPWPALARLGPPWPALARLGPPWPALARLGPPWPAFSADAWKLFFKLLNLALLRKGRYTETCITVYVRERQAFGAFTVKTCRDLAPEICVSSVGEFVFPY